MSFKKRLLILVAVAATIGGMLAVAIPQSPVSPIPMGAELSVKGDPSKAIQVAGAAVTYADPVEALAKQGITVIKRILPPGNYTTNVAIIPRAVVVHNTDSPADLGCGPVYNTFVGPSESSTNFCIDKYGVIEWYVPLEDISWGAGDISNPNMAIRWIADVVRNNWWSNQFKWDIELTLCNTSPKTGCSGGPERLEDYPLMKRSVSTLTTFLLGQAQLPATRETVVTHNDINGSSRVDPICCWTEGGVMAGAQAFDQWVASLATNIPLPPSDACWMPPLIRLEGTPDVYMVAGGVKIHLCSEDVFRAQDLKWRWVVDVSADNTLWQLPSIACR